MIVDELDTRHERERVSKSARLRWGSGEFRLSVSAPAELVAERLDASPFLCASLLLAMRLGEDLEIRGPVSGPLLTRAPRIVDRYARWDPRLFRSRVRAHEELPRAARAAGVGCFLSRGVDSLYSAAAPRALPGPVDQLVFCDGLEPIHSPEVRAEEMRLATEAASLLGLPLVVLESNIRRLTDPIVRDWEDMVGAGLAFLGTALAGGIGHVVIPSSDGPTTVGPCGTSALLDPLFSTAEVEVEHDALQTRTAKVAWLASEHPELLPLLKVCYQQDRADNCGRCSKCLVTMLALEAAGALDRATGFPSSLEPDLVRIQRPPNDLNARLEFTEALNALRAAGSPPDLIAAVEGLLAGDTAASSQDLPTDTPAFRRRASREARLLSGLPGRQARHRPAKSGPPRASVVVAARGAGPELAESVGSVLAQTEGDLELILLVDQPAACDARLPRDGRLTVVRQSSPLGAASALNRAVGGVRAPFVSLLQEGDTWEPDYLSSVIAGFDDPAVGVVYTNARIVDHPAGLFTVIPEGRDELDRFPEVAAANPVPPSSATMRTAAVRAAGGYARWLRQSGEHHLFMKLARAGWRLRYLDRSLVLHRWPKPSSSGSDDDRSRQLWELVMFGGFALRHPRTPGPRRQVRLGARRELSQMRHISRSRLAREDSARPRLLVVPGSHALLNLGDVAMLQVCVERLTSLLGKPSIGVLTSAPERLAELCPGVAPVPAEGAWSWLDHPWSRGAFSPLLTGKGRAGLERLSRLAHGAGPRAARYALRAELLTREPASDELRGFLSRLLSADGVVLAGRGGTTDVFQQDTMRMLDLLDTAAALGITTAMMGQGVGPVDNEALRARAREVLPRLDLVALRERHAALSLARNLGAAGSRLVVTGDDAIALAYERRPACSAKTGIGVGLRLSDYSRMGPRDVSALSSPLRRVAQGLGSELEAIPISLYPHETEAAALGRLTGREVSGARTPEAAIARAGACRVVVAGTYHAAVFALAQGVPVVALSSSSYYRTKLAGLAGMFPGGCEVIPLWEPGFEERLRACVERAWRSAEALRPRLLEAAEAQIDASRDAYRRLASMVAVDQSNGDAIVSHSSSDSTSARRYL